MSALLTVSQALIEQFGIFIECRIIVMLKYIIYL